MSHTRRGRFGDRRGFTLAEITVSIAMIGSTLVAATPLAAQQIQLYTLRGKAREVYAALQRTRMAAIAASQSATFTASNHSYTVTTPSETVTRDLYNTSAGVSLSSATTVTFASDGTANAVTITLTNRSNQSVTVSVSVAGRIRVG